MVQISEFVLRFLKSLFFIPVMYKEEFMMASYSEGFVTYSLTSFNP